jgi:Ras-related protein Rab-1A
MLLHIVIQDNTFTEGTVPPPGEDFKSRVVQVGDKKVNLEIWDTQGQERFRTVTSSYYRGASGMLVVYDVTNAASFEKVRQWVDDIERYSTNQSSKLLVGNRADLADKRVVSEAEGQNLANDLKLPFIETSAKTGSNVDKAFIDLAAAVSHRFCTIFPRVFLFFCSFLSFQCLAKEAPAPKRSIVGLAAPKDKPKKKKECVLL